jgi:hypothetical protein
MSWLMIAGDVAGKVGVELLRGRLLQVCRELKIFGESVTYATVRR